MCVYHLCRRDLHVCIANPALSDGLGNTRSYRIIDLLVTYSLNTALGMMYKLLWWCLWQNGPGLLATVQNCRNHCVNRILASMGIYVIQNDHVKRYSRDILYFQQPYFDLDPYHFKPLYFPIRVRPRLFTNKQTYQSNWVLVFYGMVSTDKQIT